ncbi:hypothetical protein [Tenacibaculum holothuriorum]|nr:hypothetical protein [Tenacibaculum holothuriorum]
MKKLIITLFTTLTIISCTQNDEIDQQLELNKHIKLKKNTSDISNDFFKMGVTNVIVKKESNTIEYNFNTKKNFFINGKSVDLSKYTFQFSNNFLTIKNHSYFKLSIVNNKPYVVSDMYTGIINYNNKLFTNTNFNILLFAMKEITTPYEQKFNSKQLLKYQIKDVGFGIPIICMLLVVVEV